MQNTSQPTPTQINDTVDFQSNNSLKDLSNAKTNADITTAMWGLTKETVQEIANISRVYNSKHGMFSSIPIICKGPDCAYKDVCMVDPFKRAIGARCPMEIAAILSRYEQWCQHFEIDVSTDYINPKDLVDATLIKDLVNIEIQMIRAENKIALNGDFLAITLLDIDKKCNPYFGKTVSPETEFLITLQQRKEKILNQLNATRKDKAAMKGSATASESAIEVFHKVRELEKQVKTLNQDISDVEFDEDGNVIVEEPESEIETLIKGDDVNGDGNKDAWEGS